MVRSTLARSVVAHGFISSVGLHHDNVRNEFNLVDDLIEPFRPIVDLQMASMNLDEEDPGSLSRQVRKEMTGVLRCACIVNGKKTSVLLAVDQAVISLKHAIETRDANKLELPSVIALEKID